MKSVYVIGGAGTGKSTFTAQLLDQIGLPLGPLVELHAKPNVKNVVTVRGHEVGESGIYLGVMRDSFPGTDGLDRATSPAGAEWLRLLHERGEGHEWLLAEGATLATRPFLTALHETSDLLLVHLLAEEFVKELRFMQRGSNQAEQFVKQTATRSWNLMGDMQKLGVAGINIDTADGDAWAWGLRQAFAHLTS